MTQLQVKEQERRHRPHYGKFLVKAYAKLPGSPTWSDEADAKGLMFMYFWYPDGFPEQECEDFSRKFTQPIRLTQ
jgi:hypothetical protein